MVLSTRVANMSEGGGGIEDADVVIIRARYHISTERPDYHKSIKDGKIQLMLCLTVVPFDTTGYGKAQEQIWTGGEASRIVPTADGLFLDLAPGAPPSTQLTKTSNIGQLFKSWEMHDPTTDREQPGVGISVLEGFKVHMLKIAVKGRENLAVNIPGQDPKKAPGVLLVSKIYGKDPALLAQLVAALNTGSAAQTPGVMAVPAAPQFSAPAQMAMPAPPMVSAPAPAPVQAAAPAAVPGGLDAGGLTEILMQLVSKGPVPKSSLATSAFAAVQAKYGVQRNDYLRLLTSDDFLKSAPVNYDGATVSAM